MSLEDYASVAAVAENSHATLEQTIKYFPNFAALHPDTRIQAYREFKPLRDVIELTLFWREPGEDKMRLDAEIDVKNLMKDSESEGVQPKHIKILFVGSAVTAVPIRESRTL